MLIMSNCFLEKVWYCVNHDDVSSLARMIFCEGFSSNHWHSCPPPNETMACRWERERPLRLLSFYIWKREVIHGQGTNISETYSFLQISHKQFCRRLTDWSISSVAQISKSPFPSVCWCKTVAGTEGDSIHYLFSRWVAMNKMVVTFSISFWLSFRCSFRWYLSLFLSMEALRATNTDWLLELSQPIRLWLRGLPCGAKWMVQSEKAMKT